MIPALLPLIVLAGTPVLVMLVAAFARAQRLILSLTMAGLAGSFGLLFMAAPSIPYQETGILVIDRYAIFYTGLILIASGTVALLAFPYLERSGGRPDEFYMLLLLAALGSAVLVSSNHFASFFLGLEILSVSFYALIAYCRSRPLSIEGAIKYLVLAGSSSAFLLFGMAFVYAALGTLRFSNIAAGMARPGSNSMLVLAGFGLLTVGIGFKLALVPFHLWTPDVYQGAPAPVTAFVATVSKGALFALLQRYFTAMDFQQSQALWIIFAMMAAASMLFGNFLALRQNNIKRLLAYSSIAHLGYLMVGFLAGSPAAVGFYLAAYFITTLGAFGVVTALSTAEQETEAVEGYQGLAWSQPFLAAVFTLMLLSLAGLPLTGGFIAKFYILSAGARIGLWWLLLLLVLTSSVGLVYYLRIIFALYRPIADAHHRAVLPSVPLSSACVLSAMMLLLMWLGIFPGPLLGFIQAALTSLR